MLSDTEFLEIYKFRETLSKCVATWMSFAYLPAPEKYKLTLICLWEYHDSRVGEKQFWHIMLIFVELEEPGRDWMADIVKWHLMEEGIFRFD